MRRWLALLGSLGIGALAGVGLAVVVYYEPPTSFWTVVALGLVVMAVMGVTAPLWRLALRRIMPALDEGEITRMSFRFGLWSGIFVASLILLKILGFMDSILILAILGLLIMLEMFLQQNTSHKRTSRKTRR